jgi:hypothetical protein
MTMRPIPKAILVLGFVLATVAAQEAFAREYDPRTGRFIQDEPVMSLRPHSHYTYGANNPLMYTDPTGEVISIAKGMQGPFEDFLKTHGIGGYTRTEAGGNFVYTGGTDVLTHPAAYSLNSEIFFRMISSERWFTFDTMADVQTELTIRNNTVAAAKNASWQFNMSADKKGPPGFNWTNGTFTGSPSAAVAAWFQAGADSYQASCTNFTRLVLLKGLMDTINTPNAEGKIVNRFNTFFGPTIDPIRDSYSLAGMLNKAKMRNTGGELKGQVLTSTGKYDWIPGDGGFIAPPRGDTGYNVVYVGGSYATGDALLKEPKAFYGGIAGDPASYNDWAAKLPGGSLAPWRLSIDARLFRRE